MEVWKINFSYTNKVRIANIVLALKFANKLVCFDIGKAWLLYEKNTIYL